MTEAEWLTCTDPTPMLEFLRDNVTERKLMLVVCACGRLVSHLLTDSRSKEALPIAERFADGLVSQAEMDAVFQPACNAAAEATRYSAGTTDGAPLPTWAAAWVIAKAVIATSTMRGEDAFLGAVDGLDFATSALGQSPTPLLQDIFGNPFRPAPIASHWLTPTVLSLAQAAYDNRILPAGTLDNARLAILANALEEAGCDDADILAHCRGLWPHVRGCWVVDILLGKE